MTGSASSDFVIDRSACSSTAVASVASSFEPSGSVTSELTLAVFDSPAVRSSSTCTVTCRVAEAPSASVPRFQVTMLAASSPPLSAETKLVPAGSGSVTTTFVASEGPSLVTTSV